MGQTWSKSRLLLPTPPPAACMGGHLLSPDLPEGDPRPPAYVHSCLSWSHTPLRVIFSNGTADQGTRNSPVSHLTRDLSGSSMFLKTKRLHSYRQEITIPLCQRNICFTQGHTIDAELLRWRGWNHCQLPVAAKASLRDGMTTAKGHAASRRRGRLSPPLTRGRKLAAGIRGGQRGVPSRPTDTTGTTPRRR